jgi:transposase-like protein
MIDFPIDDLLDDDACLQWLERHLHPDGLSCPRCGARERRVAQRPAAFPAYRCQQCDRFYTVLTGTCFTKTRQTPAKLVLILRGIAKGETTARLARELGLSYKQMHTLRKRVQANLYETLPTHPLAGKQFEADELYQNAGEKRRPASPSQRSAAPPRQQGPRPRQLRQ